MSLRYSALASICFMLLAFGVEWLRENLEARGRDPIIPLISAIL